MKLNTKTISPKVLNHGKTLVPKQSAEKELTRTVSSCLLWENAFYENGQTIADRIESLIKKCSPEFVASLAIHARTNLKLRHVPLLMVRIMAKLELYKKLVRKTLFEVIQRPDELCEFVKIYWKEKRQPLSYQVKKGLGEAFTKFNEYSLAKYNQNNDIKLRDVLFLSHAKPQNKEQEDLWNRLINNKLETPDTWETALGKDNKKETWTRLLKEQKLGGLAFLRNLRNITEAGVENSLVKEYFDKANFDMTLPYRFISAAKYLPLLESHIEKAMFKNVDTKKKLGGRTVLLIDVSGSMEGKLSEKSENTRLEAACGLSILARELCEDVAIYTFSNKIVSIPDRRGFALRDSIVNSQYHGATHLRQATASIVKTEKFDRIIILTDEQTTDGRPANIKPEEQGYIINVSPYQNGIAYGDWVSINGFSESVITFIQEYENLL